jgi:hypothetical protein
VVIVVNGQSPSALPLDSTSVYWTNSQGGTLSGVDAGPNATLLVGKLTPK